jgi:hypothetical protein
MWMNAERKEFVKENALTQRAVTNVNVHPD